MLRISKLTDYAILVMVELSQEGELLSAHTLTERVGLEWVSAAEGPRWAELIDEFVARITELGPSPLRADVGDAEFTEGTTGAEVEVTSS